MEVLLPVVTGLNAPYGAWCFLTICTITQSTALWTGLNAPFGARCFLMIVIMSLILAPIGES